MCPWVRPWARRWARALVRAWPRMRPECGLERRQTSLCAVFAYENVAVRGVCGLSCFRPSFRIALAKVFATGRRKTSLCAHVAKIAFSPTRNAKSNETNRHLSRETAVRDAFKKRRSRLRETRLRIPRLRETPLLKTPLSFETSAFSPRRRRKTSLCAGFASGSS